MTNFKEEELEYLDVFDEDGNKIGTEKRSVVHQKGLWHKASHIWIINSKNQLLIQKRSSKIRHPKQWDISAAGHVSSGRNSFDTALDEIKEELGINVSKKDLKFLFQVKQNYQDKKENYINNEINDVYLLKTNMPLSSFKVSKEEISELKYISINELRDFIEKEDPSFVPHPMEYRELFNYLDKNF